jgi:hypothetical protein
VFGARGAGAREGLQTGVGLGRRGGVRDGGAAAHRSGERRHRTLLRCALFKLLGLACVGRAERHSQLEDPLRHVLEGPHKQLMTLKVLLTFFFLNSFPFLWVDSS